MAELSLEQKRAAVMTKAGNAVDKALDRFPFESIKSVIEDGFSLLTPEEKALAVVCPVETCSMPEGITCIDFTTHPCSPHPERVRLAQELEAGESESVEDAFCMKRDPETNNACMLRPGHSERHDSTALVPHPDSGLEKLLFGENVKFISRDEANRRTIAADANGYERRKREEGV